jgi:hypothetical protein
MGRLSLLTCPHYVRNCTSHSSVRVFLGHCTTEGSQKEVGNFMIFTMSANVAVHRPLQRFRSPHRWIWYELSMVPGSLTLLERGNLACTFIWLTCSVGHCSAVSSIHECRVIRPTDCGFARPPISIHQIAHPTKSNEKERRRELKWITMFQSPRRYFKMIGSNSNQESFKVFPTLSILEHGNWFLIRSRCLRSRAR